MSYLVRNATARDVLEMIRIERLSSTAAHWTEQQYQDLFRDPMSARLALTVQDHKAREVAGFLIARHLSTEWELENIAVKLERRGKGIGMLLMRAFLRHVVETNSESVFLEVRESNAAARGLYEKLGFHETGRRKSYYMNPIEDAVLYRKNLPAR